MTAGVSFPGMGLGTPVSLTAGVDFANGLLVVSNIAGEIADGPVAGNVNAEIKDGLPHLSGDLAMDAFDLEPVAAMLVGEPALQGAEGDWPTAPFQAKVATPFTADLDLTFGSVAAGIFGVLEDAQMHAALARDGVRLSDVSGKLDGGELTGLFEARNNDGTTLASTQFKLAGADLGQVLDGSGLTGIGRHHRFAFGERQVDGGAGRLAVGLGNGGGQGCAHPRHQPGRVPGAAGRCRQGRPRDRCGAHGSLRAGHRVCRNLRRAARADRLHRRGRRAARPARHARCGRGLGVGRPQDRIRHRRGGGGRHGHLCGRRRGGGRIGSRRCGSPSRGRSVRCRANTIPSRWRSS